MRLSQRLALVFSLFGLAIAGGFQFNHVRDVRAQSYALFTSMAEGTAAAVKTLVEAEARSGGDFSRLGRDLGPMVGRTGIATIVIRDRKGQRLVGRSDDVRWLSREPHPELSIGKAADGIYDVEKPVDLGERGKGVVQIGFHTEALRERLRDIESLAVLSGVTAFLAITIFAWLMGMSFGLRIERLVPRFEALPRDPASFRPIRSPASGGEVARLVNAYNRLGASLKSETLLRREIEREKQELSAMLVHDLKTPLTVIRSGITLLQEQMSGLNGNGAKGRRPKVEYPKRTFELLEMSADRLHRMVEDVLQLARLEEVAGLRERVPVDLAEMAKVCAKDFELIAADRGQRVFCDAPAEAVAVLGDAVLLRRVLDNLVHNAVEHTPRGGRVAIAVGSNGLLARVSVSDSGPGVPPEARADLFRKFFQKDLKRHVGNVGLGLALCEKVVQRHEGRIGIEDAEPKGARFYFELPMAQPHLI